MNPNPNPNPNLNPNPNPNPNPKQVSAFFNRHTTSVAQCQIGFINIIIRPFYVEVRKLLGDECQVCLDELDRNLHAWETEGNALVEGCDLSPPEGASLGFY